MKFKILALIGITLFSVFSVQAQKKYTESEPKGMSFVPQGSFTMKAVENNDTVNISVSVDAFWISNEITNAEYKEYVEYIRKHPDSLMCRIDMESAVKAGDLPKTKDGMYKYVKCLKYSEILLDIIDTTKLPYKDYFTNKKYNNYPVVGVSQQQASFYCNWKTQMENTKLAKSGKPYVHDYRLPVETEWAYVASQPSTGKKKLTQDKHLISPSMSGEPNDWGIYNLSGNVSEWTASKQQNMSGKTDVGTANQDMGIILGGSWKTGSNINEKNIFNKNTKEDYIGFRIVRSYLGSKE